MLSFSRCATTRRRPNVWKIYNFWLRLFGLLCVRIDWDLFEIVFILVGAVVVAAAATLRVCLLSICCCGSVSFAYILWLLPVVCGVCDAFIAAGCYWYHGFQQQQSVRRCLDANERVRVRNESERASESQTDDSNKMVKYSHTEK